MPAKDYEAVESITDKKKERGPGVLGPYFAELREHAVDHGSKQQGDLILMVRRHVLDCKAKAFERLSAAIVTAADHEALAKPSTKQAKAEQLLRDWGVPAAMSEDELKKRVSALTVDFPGPMLLEFVGKDAKRDFDRLVVQNLRLVVSIAKEYGQSRMSLEDIIQNGNLGLIRGIALNEPERGHKLSTYCTWWIRSVIQRATIDTAHDVRMPVHLADAKARIKRIRASLRGRHGRPPTIGEVADEIIAVRKAKKSKAKDGGRAARDRDAVVKEIERADKAHDITCVSLNKPTLRGEGDELIDLMAPLADETRDPETSIMRDQALVQLRVAIEKLTPAERKVIAFRYGFADPMETEMTLREIGDEFGLSRERIRQIQVQALEKLEHALNRLGRA